MLVTLLVVSAAYTNVTTFPPSVETGYLPRATRGAIVVLVVFVFAFYAVLPLLSALVLWGGRLLRSWRVAIPAL